MSDVDEGRPDRPMTPEQEARARSLTAAALQRIDECLLSHISDRWQKVARIVALTMQKLHHRFPGVPDVLYSGRIRHLADSGAIEAAGDLHRMRFSEVRLPAENSVREVCRQHPPLMTCDQPSAAVIPTDDEGAKRLRRNGGILRMRPLPG